MHYNDFLRFRSYLKGSFGQEPEVLKYIEEKEMCYVADTKGVTKSSEQTDVDFVQEGSSIAYSFVDISLLFAFSSYIPIFQLAFMTGC